MIEYIFKAYNSDGEVVSTLRESAAKFVQVLLALDTFEREARLEHSAVRVTSDIAL